MLGEEIYTHTKALKYVMLRLDSTLASGGAVYEARKITVEHVLPQTPKHSDWLTAFSDSERRYWVHRLANLVLLTGPKNSQAGTYDFLTKKNRYFQGKLGVTEFPLTTQVLLEGAWTPEVLQRRQKDLLDHLERLWRLMP